VSPTRFRVPDVCVVLGRTNEQIFRTPPFLCIEVLSPEDRLKRVEERIQDYLRMGVRYVWLLDHSLRIAYEATEATGLREVKDSALRTEDPVLELPLGEIFS